jgi:hypothetical protein
MGNGKAASPLLRPKNQWLVSVIPPYYIAYQPLSRVLLSGTPMRHANPHRNQLSFFRVFSSTQKYLNI